MSRIQRDEQMRQVGGDALQEAYERFVQEGIAQWHKERGHKELGHKELGHKELGHHKERVKKEQEQEAEKRSKE